MRCEDCGATVFGFDDELEAIRAGVTICEECINAMEWEAAMYDQIMAEEGYRCEFDPERGFVRVRTTQRTSATDEQRGMGR